MSKINKFIIEVKKLMDVFCTNKANKSSLNIASSQATLYIIMPQYGYRLYYSLY
jgi:hypothetical protein